jgi:hypothetical protein
VTDTVTEETTNGKEVQGQEEAYDVTFEDRVKVVLGCMRAQRVEWAGQALYDQVGKPIMTPDGRHAVRLFPIEGQEMEQR